MKKPYSEIPRQVLLPIILCLSYYLVPATGHTTDEYAYFVNAKNAYDVGDYQEAVNRFDNVLKKGLHNAALVLECHKFIAVSYLFIGDRIQAEHHFTELLTRSPAFTLDPIIFPMDVMDFFTRVKEKNGERLQALAKAKREEKRKHKEAEASRIRTEIEKLRTTDYFERTRVRHSIVVAMIPMGAGQFQNGDNLKGSLLLASELILSATAATSFILHEKIRSKGAKPFEPYENVRDYKNQERIFRVTNQISLAALGIVAIGGLIDSLYNFEAETVTWKKVDESETPAKLRHNRPRSTTRIHPYFGSTSIGLGVLGKF